ncbi:MAG: DUF881 domain-containing protein [Armatimonadota bacterium]
MQRFSHPILVLAALSATAALSPLGAAELTPTALKERLAQAELLAGITAVSGPGIVVTLRHSPRAVPQGADAASFRIAERDVTAVLNALRGAGAEALAVAGDGGALPERVIATTAVRDHGDGITVNGAPLTPPYRILAIGEAPRFRSDLFREGGVVKTAALDTLQMIEVEEASRVVVPGYRQTAGFRFARPLDQPKKAEAPAPAAPTAAKAAPAPVEQPGPARPVKAQTGAEKSTLASAGPRAPQPLLASQPEPELQEGAATEPSGSPQAPASPPAPAPKAETRPAPSSPGPAPAKKAEAPRPTPAPAARPSPAGAVFAGEKQAKYHRAGCRLLDRIPADQRTRFADAGEADRSGREACALCAPPAKPAK